ncbi:MAG: hypothetical protein ACI97K_003250 [Glaciecola sp.]
MQKSAATQLNWVLCYLKDILNLEINPQYQALVGRFISLSAGILFAFLSVTIIGYGAAIAVPKDILGPLMHFSPTFALSLTDFVTIGMPLAASFYLLTLIFRRLVKVVYSSLLVGPFILFMLYGLVTIGYDNESLWYYAASSVAKVLPVLLCAILLDKQGVQNTEI